MKGYIITIIGINPGGGDDRASEITADIFYNRVRVTKVRFGINVESVFIFAVNGSLSLFERGANRFPISSGSTVLIPSTAPPHILIQPLRYILFPPSHVIKFLNLHQKRDNIVVLDMGCGPGYYSIPIAKSLNGTLIAMDIREKMLSIVKRRADRKKINNIVYLKCDGCKIELSDNSVDLICLYLVLGEFTEIEESIKECSRVLKQNGKISIMESIFDDHYMNVNEVETIFKNNGFSLRLIEQKRTYYLMEANNTKTKKIVD